MTHFSLSILLLLFWIPSLRADTSSNFWNVLQNSNLPLVPPPKPPSAPNIAAPAGDILPSLKAQPNVFDEETEEREYEGNAIRALKMNPNLATPVGVKEFFARYSEHLMDPKLSMVPPPIGMVRSDSLGIKYHRYSQRFADLPIFDAQFILKEQDGRVVSGRGRIATQLDLDTQPSIGASEALATALAAVGDVLDGDSPQGILGIVSQDFLLKPGTFHLVWRFLISTQEKGSFFVDVDAKSGALLHQVSRTKYAQDPTFTQNVNCTGKSLYYSPNVSIVCDLDNQGTYRLISEKDESDARTQARIVLRDGRPNATSGGNPDGLIFSTQDPSGHFSGENDKVGVTALYSLQTTLQYFWNTFNWRGLDGLGQKTIQAKVMGKLKNAAGLFDKGTLLLNGEEQEGAGPAVDLLVVAHEFTHGLCDETVFNILNSDQNSISASLEGYIYQGESGALEEGFADLMGILARRTISGGKIDWCAFGDSLINAPICTSDISNPNLGSYPTTYGATDAFYVPLTPPCDLDKNDACGVHTNSMILKYWFYLLVTGKDGFNHKNDVYHVEAIKVEEAEQILFHTMAHHLVANATFLDACKASIEVADQLFKNSERREFIVQNVQNAWHAVGVCPKYEVPRYYSPANGAVSFDPWVGEFLFEVFPDKEMNWSLYLTDEAPSENSVKSIQDIYLVNHWENRNGKKLAVFPVNTARKPLTLKTHRTYFWAIHPNFKKPDDLPASDKVSEVNTWTQLFEEFSTEKTTPQGRTSVINWNQFNKDDQETIAWLGVKGREMYNQSLFFTTAKKDPPIKAPGKNQKFHPWQTTFKVGAVAGAEQYYFVVSENPTISCTPPSNPTGNDKPALGNLAFYSESSGGGQDFQTSNPAGGPVVSMQTETRLLGNSLALLPGGQEAGAQFNLLAGKKYYWFARAKGPQEWGECSNNGIGIPFETQKPQAQLLGPQNYANLPPFGVTLSWKRIPGAKKYWVQVAKGKNSENQLQEILETKVIPQGNSDTLSAGFKLNEKNYIYWQVTAIGPHDDSGTPSEIRFFQIDEDLGKPDTVKPKGSVSYNQATVEFTWTPVAGAEKYELTIFKQNPSGQIVLQKTDAFTHQLGGSAEGFISAQVSGSIAASDKGGYCWKVRGVAGSVLGPDSPTECYMIGPSKPILISPAFDASVDKNAIPFQWDGYAPYGWRLKVFTGSNPNQGTIYSGDYSSEQKGGNLPIPALTPGSYYGWRIYALPPPDSNSDGPWAESRFKATEAQEKKEEGTGSCSALAKPKLLSPPWPNPGGSACSPDPYCFSYQSGTYMTTLPFQWSAVPGASNYHVSVYVVSYNQYLAGQNGQLLAQKDFSGTSGSLQFQSNWSPGIFSWEVIAKNSCGQTLSSGPGYFQKKSY